MKVEFEFQRLDKPLGGWRYGLKMAVRVVMTEEEEQSLGALWGLTFDLKPLGWPEKAYLTPRQMAGEPACFIVNQLLFSGCQRELLCRAVGRQWSRILHKYSDRTLTITMAANEWPGATLYFEKPEEVELAILCGRELAKALAESITQWLEEHRAEPGDASPTIEEFHIGSNTTAPVEARRVIRRAE